MYREYTARLASGCVKMGHVPVLRPNLCRQAKVNLASKGFDKRPPLQVQDATGKSYWWNKKTNEARSSRGCHGHVTNFLRAGYWYLYEFQLETPWWTSLTLKSLVHRPDWK